MLGVTSPLVGEHRPPSAAVLKKNAETKLRLRRIVRCDPGEGLRPIDRCAAADANSGSNFQRTEDRHCERSEAIQSPKVILDCFVASLFAMTALQCPTRICDLAARCAHPRAEPFPHITQPRSRRLPYLIDSSNTCQVIQEGG